jgi:cytidylate kinase
MAHHSIGRIAESLQNAYQHRGKAAAQEAGEHVPALSIAIAREAGSAASAVAHEVGAHLGWAVYDHELLQRIAEETGQRVKLLESLDERRQSWLEECMENFSSAPTIGENAYVRHLVVTLLSLAAQGHCIIVGRGSALILPEQTTLRVLLIGNLDDRIDVVSRRLNMPRQKAARWVRDKDHERTRFIQDHFQKDPKDPHWFDLIVNMSRWSIPESAALIVDAYQRMLQRVTPSDAAVLPDQASVPSS